MVTPTPTEDPATRPGPIVAAVKPTTQTPKGKTMNNNANNNNENQGVEISETRYPKTQAERLDERSVEKLVGRALEIARRAGVEAQAFATLAAEAFDKIKADDSPDLTVKNIGDADLAAEDADRNARYANNAAAQAADAAETQDLARTRRRRDQAIEYRCDAAKAADVVRGYAGLDPLDDGTYAGIADGAAEDVDVEYGEQVDFKLIAEAMDAAQQANRSSTKATQAADRAASAMVTAESRAEALGQAVVDQVVGAARRAKKQAEYATLAAKAAAQAVDRQDTEDAHAQNGAAITHRDAAIEAADQAEALAYPSVAVEDLDDQADRLDGDLDQVDETLAVHAGRVLADRMTKEVYYSLNLAIVLSEATAVERAAVRKVLEAARVARAVATARRMTREADKAHQAAQAAAKAAELDGPPALVGGQYMYFVDAGFLVEGKGYRPSIVVEGVRGHYPNGGGDVEPWYWGFDLAQAQAIAKKRNKALGLDNADVVRILAASMAAAE